MWHLNQYKYTLLRKRKALLKWIEIVHIHLISSVYDKLKLVWNPETFLPFELCLSLSYIIKQTMLEDHGLSFIQLDLGSPAGYAQFLDLPSVASFYSHTTSFSNYINWVLLFLFFCLFAYVNIHFQILLCVLEFGYKQIHFTPEAHIIVCIKIAVSYLLVNVEWVWTSVAVLIKSCSFFLGSPMSI